MVRKLLAASLSLLVLGGLALQAEADGNQTVNATVTPLLISVNITGGPLAYGVQQPGTTGAIPNPAFVTVENNGSVTEKFNVRGGATTPSGWSLGSTAGADVYVHRFGTSNSPSTALTTSDQQLASGVTPTSNIQLFLALDMPTTTSSYAQHTLPVIVTATQ